MCFPDSMSVRPSGRQRHRGSQAPPAKGTMIRIRRPTGDSTKDQPVRLLWVLGWSLAGLLMVGCEPTHSSASNDDGESMFFGLFKTKSPSNVNPQIGAALVREASFPRGEGAQPQPDYPAVRRASLTAPPPQGRISSTAIEQASANAYITRELPGASVLVNVYEPERRCELWKIDGEDTTRLSHQQSLRFEADQSRWIMYGAGDAIALPGERLLVQLRYFNPSPTDRAYVIDMQWFREEPRRNTTRLACRPAIPLPRQPSAEVRHSTYDLPDGPDPHARGTLRQSLRSPTPVLPAPS